MMADGAKFGKYLGLIPNSPLEMVQVSAEIGANEDTATAIDIVFVYDSAALAVLPKTGPLWFANKADLQAGLGPAIDILSLQVLPASVLTAPVLPHRHAAALGVYSFVDFLDSAGQAQGNLSTFRCVAIVLAPTAVKYQHCA